MNYEAADRCNDCPQRNDEKGCPWWWEVVEGGDIPNVRRKCGKAWLPFILVELTKSMNRMPASFDRLRTTLEPMTELLEGTKNLVLIDVHKRGG